MRTNPQDSCYFVYFLLGFRFSSVGDPSLKYDDNGWIFCARAEALAKAALICPEPTGKPAGGKVKIMFWGHLLAKWAIHFFLFGGGE